MCGVLLVLLVDGFDKLKDFVDLLVLQRRLLRVVVFEKLGEYVPDGLPPRVAHGIRRSVDTFSEQL